MDLSALRPDPLLLLTAAAADAILGDPVYRWHPVRLLGALLERVERGLRAAGLDGRFGGFLLFVLLASAWAGGLVLATVGLAAVNAGAAAAFHVFILYSSIALRDLLRHGSRVDVRATEGDLEGARSAAAQLVGRDTAPMDAAACRRAAIESMSENVVDGYISPLFWYLLAGLPGALLFKVVSTMDSMVGYKTPRYLRFGWCGARLDDLLNWIPARLTWLLAGSAAAFIRGCSSMKAWRTGWRQHAIVPGPNSGWSEAGFAGALQRRLIGPIWSEGRLVTEIWLGDPDDPEGGSEEDFRRAAWLTAATALLFVACAAVITSVG